MQAREPDRRPRVADSEVTRALRELFLGNGDAMQSLARRVGVGLSDATALNHLSGSAQGMGPSELGQRLGMRSASATALVDRLEAAGHVRRVPHPSDRRRQTVVVTERAVDEMVDALAPLLRRIDEAAARLTPEQARATARFLAEAAAAMRAYAEEA